MKLCHMRRFSAKSKQCGRSVAAADDESFEHFTKRIVDFTGLIKSVPMINFNCLGFQFFNNHSWFWRD